MVEIGGSQFLGAPLELGQSGASLSLIQSSTGGSVIIKRDSANALRLIKQYEKQILVAESFSPFISVPKILSDFSDSSFAMEFIHGQTLGEFLETSTRDELTSVSDQINGYLGSNKEPSSEVIDIDPIVEKILAIKSSLSNSVFNPIFIELADILRNRISEVNTVTGLNHGDFSFENLLVEKFTHKVFAIDFLDSPVETRLIDYGRFWLDVNFGWWANWGKESTRYSLNRDYIGSSLTKALEAQNIPRFDVEFFCGIAILRITPYTKNPKRIAFLQHAARQLVKELNWN
jgi:tRNA A-37 threonylcarbamoyl transferase component Bud32